MYTYIQYSYIVLQYDSTLQYSVEGLQLTKRDRPYEALIKADWSEVGPCTLVR